MASAVPSSFGNTPGATDPKRMVIVFLLLTFAFSSVFWYLTAVTPQVAGNAGNLMIYAVGAMWGPALAAVATRLIFQRNLRGFHIRPGKSIWLIAAILLPIAVGLLMFSSAWISGIAPFNPEHAAIVLSVTFIPAFLYAIAFNLFAATGEEIGWRGFLVPELARFQTFTTLALLSAAIWTVWHFPMIIFGTYHGTGSILYSLAVFIPSVMGAGIVLAWLRLMSGSIWPAVLFHGFWNYFIQSFYPALTVTTPYGDAMLGEFGWFCAAAYVILGIVFWYFRDRLPELPGEDL